MANIKSTLTLSSTTLFPNPAGVTIAPTNQINGNSDFQKVTIFPNGTSTVFGPSLYADPSDTVYLYAAAPATNTGSLTLKYTDFSSTSSVFATLRPGDFMYLPMYVPTSGVTMEAINESGANSNDINIFWGARA